MRKVLEAGEREIQYLSRFIPQLQERIAFYQKQEVFTFSGVDYLKITWDKVNQNNIELVHYVKSGIQLSMYTRPQLVGSIQQASTLASTNGGIAFVEKGVLTKTQEDLLSVANLKLSRLLGEQEILKHEFIDMFYKWIGLLKERYYEKRNQLRGKIIRAAIQTIHLRYTNKLNQSQRAKEVGFEVLNINNTIEGLNYNYSHIFNLEWKNPRRGFKRSTKTLYLDLGDGDLLKLLPSNRCMRLSVEEFKAEYQSG